MIDKLVKELAEIINDLIDKSYWDGLEDGEKGVDGQPQYEIDKNILTKALTDIREQTLEEVMRVLNEEDEIADDEAKAGWTEHCACLKHAIHSVGKLQSLKEDK